MHHPLPLAVLAAAFLSACGGSSGPIQRVTDPDPIPDPVTDPVPVMEATIVENANGTLTLTFEGEEFAVPEPTANVSGELEIRSNDPENPVFGELDETNDYFAVAGTDGSEFFAAVDGDTVTPPTGSAVYEGRYEFVTGSGSEKGGLTLNFDVATSELSGADSRVSVSATSTAAGELTGKVTVDSADAGYSGGFYGAGGDFAGAFVGEDFSGILYGSQPD